MATKLTKLSWLLLLSLYILLFVSLVGAEGFKGVATTTVGNVDGSFTRNEHLNVEEKESSDYNNNLIFYNNNLINHNYVEKWKKEEGEGGQFMISKRYTRFQDSSISYCIGLCQYTVRVDYAACYDVCTWNGRAPSPWKEFIKEYQGKLGQKTPIPDGDYITGKTQTKHKNRRNTGRRDRSASRRCKCKTCSSFLCYL